MRVALVAPPFLPVPPVKYGGTELFIAQHAEGLKNSGVEAVVYTNGDPRLRPRSAGFTRMVSGQSRAI